eukprot:1887216-Pyramimonas_sp.AAC.1
MGAGTACGPCRWGVRWCPLCGREAREGRVGMGAGAACGRSRWGLRWSSLRGHETWEGRA